MNLPWFMFSPSPVSLIQYAVLTWIFWGYFLRAAAYRNHSRILAAIDSFFLVAFFVVLTDSFWCVFCILKWLPLYPQDTLQIFSSLGRDLLAAALFWIFLIDHKRAGVFTFDGSVKFWLLISFISQGAWFFLAPSIIYTDYTQAWIQGSSLEFVLAAWIFSHFIMRIPLWMALINTRRQMLR